MYRLPSRECLNVLNNYRLYNRYTNIKYLSYYMLISMHTHMSWVLDTRGHHLQTARAVLESGLVLTFVVFSQYYQ